MRTAGDLRHRYMRMYRCILVRCHFASLMDVGRGLLGLNPFLVLIVANTFWLDAGLRVEWTFSAAVHYAGRPGNGHPGAVPHPQ